MNRRTRYLWTSFTIASYLLTMVIAVSHHHDHSAAGTSCSAHGSVTKHCDDHQPEDNHPHNPKQHDDCLICQHLSSKPLSPTAVVVVAAVEFVSLVEPLSLDQPSDAHLAGYDCRGPPFIG